MFLVPGLRFICPLPGNPGAPWFKVSNILTFLEQEKDVEDDQNFGNGPPKLNHHEALAVG